MGVDCMLRRNAGGCCCMRVTFCSIELPKHLVLLDVLHGNILFRVLLLSLGVELIQQAGETWDEADLLEAALPYHAS